MAGGLFCLLSLTIIAEWLTLACILRSWCCCDLAPSRKTALALHPENTRRRLPAAIVSRARYNLVLLGAGSRRQCFDYLLS